MKRQISSDPLTSRRIKTDPSPDCIVHAVTGRVAGEFGLDPAALLAPTRGAPEIAFARQVAMYLAHVGFALNFAAVGRMFARDRTTVAHACRVIEDCRDDRRFDHRLAALERACEQLSGRREMTRERRSRPQILAEAERS